MPKTKPFDENLNKYELWFKNYKAVYESELEAIKIITKIPDNAIEIGVGSGLFSFPLGIKKGIEPSAVMAKKAIQRGVEVISGTAESIPCKSLSIDYVLMVTTICFVDDVQKSLNEVYRILKPGGSFVLGFVDKASPLGEVYLEFKDKNIFYKDAVFFDTKELLASLKYSGFVIEKIYQTVFGMLDEIKSKQQPIEGFGKGGFVVIHAIKPEK